MTLEGPCIIFCNIYTFQRDTHCRSTECLLILRCQLYMFRTVKVHPQELLFRCCMCRLWYVVRTALSDTSRWYKGWGSSSSTFQRDIVGMYIYIFNMFRVLKDNHREGSCKNTGIMLYYIHVYGIRWVINVDKYCTIMLVLLQLSAWWLAFKARNI